MINSTPQGLMPLLAIDFRKSRKPVPSTYSDYVVNLKKKSTLLTLKLFKLYVSHPTKILVVLCTTEQIYPTTNHRQVY